MAQIPTRQSWIKRFFSEDYTWDATIAFAALVPASFGIWKANHDNQDGWAIFLATATSVTFLALIIKNIIKFRRHGVAESKHELDGCLHTLLAVLTYGAGINRPHKLRVTLHVPVDGGEYLEQATEYIGDQRGGPGTSGRRTRANCGLIGKAYTHGGDTALMAKRDTENYEDYIRELVSTYHYTEAVARKLNPASMSWLAVPLRDSTGKVCGIVFCDSVDPEFFTDERQYLACAASVGIAQFVATRYK